MKRAINNQLSNPALNEQLSACYRCFNSFGNTVFD